MERYLIYLYLISFMFIGACMASFICCASNRYKNHEDFLKSRSHCDTCNHALTPLDLIPVFSWIFLKGKCRYCKSKIPINSTLEEIGLAIIFGYAWMYLASYQFMPLAWVRFIFMIVLGCVAVIDAEIEEVPYTTQIIFGLCAVAASIMPKYGRSYTPASFDSFVFNSTVMYNAVAAIGIMIGSVILAIIIQKYMGQGDVVIYFACTLVFSPGSTAVIVLVSSFIAILIFALEKIMRSSMLVKVDNQTSMLGIRLVPAITLAVVIVSHFQDEIDYVFLV